MLRVLLSIFIISFSAQASRPCEVYGISDSPQKLTCQFPARIVRLSCQNGTYYLNQSRVQVAFHMEVEDGPVPLVFKAHDMKLTVLMNPVIEAELELQKAEIKGTCK